MGRPPYHLATEMVLVSNRCYSCVFTINNGSSGLLWIFCLTSLRAGTQIYNKRFQSTISSKQTPAHMGSIHLDLLAPYGKADVCKLPQYLLTVTLQQNCTVCECMLPNL